MGKLAWIGTLLLGLTGAGCGKDAEARYAGMDELIVHVPGHALGYRLRYLHPPWKIVDDDPLVTTPGATVQFGALDKDGDKSQPDLVPVAKSARVLEIDRATDTVAPGIGVITYPKYRLEACVLDCAELGIPVASDETCAERLSLLDQKGRGSAERGGFFGAKGRDERDDQGQPYHEFMTLVEKSQRYRRVVYFETGDALKQQFAVRLGFEANPPLSEREVTNMINAFEVLEGDWSADSQSDAGGAP